MSETGTPSDKTGLTGQQIHDEGLNGWRKVLNKLIVRFETGDFNTGAALVVKIAEAADEVNHHPDVDLRYPHLTVSLLSHDVGAITPRDIRLARRISELAADAGVSPAAEAPDVIELALDTPNHESVRPFYEALLGYKQQSSDDLVDGADRTPSLWFQKTDSDAPDRQRWHLDVSVPHDVAEARIQAAVDAGGKLVDEGAAPAFWVLEDPDGNRSCICTWQSRD
jgi:4a-hydroxytetrahydrobiopterin dehydratase